MLVTKKQIAETVQSRITEAQSLANDNQIQTVVVVTQHSARKYGVYVQFSSHRTEIKVGDTYSYDGQEMTVHAVINPETKTETKTEIPTTSEAKVSTTEFYQLGKLTRQDCVNAVKENNRTHLIRVTNRGYEILDRRPLGEKLTNPLKNTLANFGDGHYLVTEARYQELVSN